MKINTLLHLIGGLTLAASCASLRADLIITPNTPTSNVAANAGSSLANLVNGDSGSLSTPLPTGTDVTTAVGTTHALDAVAGSYVTPSTGASTNYFDDGGTIPVLTFTLDQVYNNISSILLWNYTHDNEANQTDGFEVAFFSDLGATNQIGSVYSGNMLERPGAATSVAAEKFDFASTYSGVQSFTVTLTSNHSSNRVGLGEVRLAYVPEPSSLILILTALAGGLAVRRFRRR